MQVALKKNKRRTIVVVAEIIALAVFVIAFINFGSEKINPKQVFAFAGNIEAGTKITEKDLIRVPISSMTKTVDMIDATDFASVIGKYTMTDVYVNTIVYRQQLSDVNTSGTLGAQDLSNSLTISLPIDFTEGIAGDLKAGDRVNLLFKSSGAVADAQGNENEFYYAKIFMTGVPVYQVNTSDGYKFVSRANKFRNEVVSSSTDNVEDLTGSADVGDIASITLIVTPEQFEQIEARRLAGDIKFAKCFDETQAHETLGFVIGNYGKIFSGNANAETGNLQIVDSYTDDDPNKQQNINTNKGNVIGNQSVEEGEGTVWTSGEGTGEGSQGRYSPAGTGMTAVE